MPARKQGFRNGRLSKEGLGKEAEMQMRDHSRTVLRQFWEAVGRRLDADDRKTMELVARIYQYDKGPGGTTIFNQLLTVNAQTAHDHPRVRSFDQIIGKLELRDETRILLAQPEDDPDILTAEIEDPEPAELSV